MHSLKSEKTRQLLSELYGFILLSACSCFGATLTMCYIYQGHTNYFIWLFMITLCILMIEYNILYTNSIEYIAVNDGYHILKKE